MIRAGFFCRAFAGFDEREVSRRRSAPRGCQRGLFAQLRHRRLQLRNAFSGATQVAQMPSFSRLGRIEAGEGVARHGFMTRCLRAQLTQGD